MFSVKYVILIIISLTGGIDVVEENGQVEVRSVLIGCEPDKESDSFDNEARRFEREELFKHSELKDCRKKLAVTVKSASDPDNSGDEYIPIEHVFQGPKKRVRLLNPYVLRLRREPPLQAYKLRKVDTVNAKLYQDTEARIKRNSGSREYNISSQYENVQSHQPLTEAYETNSKNCFLVKNGTTKDHKNIHLCLSNRIKRQEIDDIVDTFTQIIHTNNAIDTYEDPDPSNTVLEHENTNIMDEGDAEIISTPLSDWKINNDDSMKITTSPYQMTLEPNLNENRNKIKENVQIQEKLYDMYDVGNADLWYAIQVQLFEKKTSSDGKPEWVDLSDGAPAKVGSLNREWTGPHMSVRFRSSEWIPRDEFTLSVRPMRLLTPVKTVMSSSFENKGTEHIVVPLEDLIESKEQNQEHTSKNNDVFPNLEPTSTEQNLREVVIRTSRALVSGNKGAMNMENKAGEQFLTIVHRQPYHFQIDLEARADGNQLVYVGSSGRLMTLVSDSSRQTRTVLTVQATNTGLAAARFRVIARNCNPELNINDKVDGEDAGYVLIPPRHTRTIKLDVPFELPVDSAHCTIDLINGDGQSVAVRDVTMKKGDRCYCVWHCECVCLGEDPKLLCRDMTEMQQIAAGLALNERTRSIRSVCYQDVLSLNICFTSIGAFILLLFFGFVKASLGLVFECIGRWGLKHMLQMPRKLEHYYEPCLRNCPVIYDDEGWPIHPMTGSRTVRLISLPMEFVLNVIFFVTVPCLLLYGAAKNIYGLCMKKSKSGEVKITNAAQVDGPNNMQGTHRRSRIKCRRTTLERWMTPQAEDLSANIWKKGIARPSVISDMRPILHEQHLSGHQSGPAQESCGDSELDDTEYVLMQMQKSRESLAKSQGKPNSTTPITMKKQ